VVTSRLAGTNTFNFRADRFKLNGIEIGSPSPFAEANMRKRVGRSTAGMYLTMFRRGRSEAQRTSVFLPK